MPGEITGSALLIRDTAAAITATTVHTMIQCFVLSEGYFSPGDEIFEILRLFEI